MIECQRCGTDVDAEPHVVREVGSARADGTVARAIFCPACDHLVRALYPSWTRPAPRFRLVGKVRLAILRRRAKRRRG